MSEVDIKDRSDDEVSSGISEADNSNNSGDEENEDDNDLANTGWADAISKILKQKSKKKTLVLSKAKKLTDVKKKKPEPSGFEIEAPDGVVKVKEEDSSEEKEDVKPELEEPLKKKRKELPKLRIKPDILEKDRERLLQKIATKGVVQLFNAVRMQQKDISKKLEEAGPLEVRREKVLKNIDKRAFLDVLMGEKSQRVDSDIQKNKKNESNTDTTWSVLKEDFMMGAKMKDWDKALENEDEEFESD